MKLKRIATPLLAVTMLASSSIMMLAQTPKTTTTPQNATDPSGGPEQEQAYRDGVEAAKLDTLAKRKIDAASSHLYVHPPVKKDARDAYREKFKNGYETAVKKSATS